MSQDGSNRIFRISGSVWISRAIVGVSITLALVHLLYVLHSRESDSASAASQPFPPFNPVLAVTAGGDVTGPPADPQMIEIGDDTQVGHVRLSDDQPEAELRYFPEALEPRQATPQFIPSPEPEYAASRGTLRV